ncbi:MAG: site-specific DNA-methyltransferase [Prevotella sp.]|nr:site-specific DNA-methyltransferase [Prevotella sp.]
MLDQADLDFGIYRIMNQKRNDIEKYLNGNLKAQVTEILERNKSAQTEKIEEELAKAKKDAEGLGISPDDLPKVKELKAKLLDAGNTEDLENEVYSHLTTFFSRYYDGGDFISQRRYKKDVYAIPYEGEEVKLHWANADQYYIKTGEYFRNYRFKLDSGKVVEFTLKDATTEQNNNKAQNNMGRRFALHEDCPIEIVNGELHINFTYELYPKATKQKTLIDTAFTTVKEQIPTEFAMEVLVPRPTESDKSRTLLQKHLNDYVARNTFDYFIHKDLKGFLTRELDFYIKNEILEIDDIDARSTDSFLAHLTVIKAIKNVGNRIIEFLASLENFQKRLWLKKKMVVAADYCITLDRIPESFYPEICANNAQREEWVRLFAIDEITPSAANDFFSQNGKAGYTVPLTPQFLKENPFLVLDTAFFDDKFKRKLISGIDNLDEQCDGVLINSENFQALELIINKYYKLISGIYIDPPYNTNATPIIYKNSYKNSTWLSLMNDRICASKQMLTNNYFYSIAIDDTELHNLYKLLENIFINSDFFQTIVNHYPGSGTGRSNVSKTHEYNIFVLPKDLDLLRGDAIPERERTRGFCRSGTGDNNYRHGRPNSFYAVLIDDVTKEIKGVEEPPIASSSDYPKDATKEGYIRIYPIGADGSERCWSLGYETAKTAIKNGLLKCSSNNVIQRLYYDESDWELLPSIWIDSKYSAVANGTNLLTKLFGKSGLFSFPKSIYTEMTAIGAGMYNNRNGYVLDYFAGSGTTGHAVINLNRNDGGKRKYILVEMGDYFDTVTKPRIQKVIYSEDWNNGKPVSRKGSSHCFKYMRLEQYEDTLNNLVIEKNTSLDNSGEFYDGYMLGYLLDTETRDSLFSLEWFVNPWNTKLKITRNNEMREEKIDLIETFNYLIGLNVVRLSYPKDNICVVEGYNRKNEHILVIWRDCKQISNEELNNFFEKMDYSTHDREFDKIFVNGDNNLENLKTEEDTWKVILIEQEFSKRMFEAE